MPTTNEIVVDAASGDAWIQRTAQKVSRTGIDGSNPGDIGNDILIIETSSPFGIIGTAQPCGLNLIREVGDKWKCTSPGLARQPQKLDAISPTR